MKQKFLVFFIIIIILVFGAIACQPNQSANTANTANTANMTGSPGVTAVKTAAVSPTDAYKQLYEAVQNKDLAKIKGLMSQNSLGLAEFAAQQQKKMPDDVLKNGFIEENLSPTMPQTRDERIKDNFGALEVQNTNGSWKDYGFILEDGGWKVAVGDMFKGTYQKPAPSQSERENPNPTMIPAPGANGANNPKTGKDTLPLKPGQMPTANIAAPKTETNKPLPVANANAVK